MHRNLLSGTQTHLLTGDDGKQRKTNQNKDIETSLPTLFNHFSGQHAFAGIKTGYTDPKVRIPRPFWPICGLKKLTNCVAELVARYNNLEARREGNGGRGLQADQL